MTKKRQRQDRILAELTDYQRSVVALTYSWGRRLVGDLLREFVPLTDGLIAMEDIPHAVFVGTRVVEWVHRKWAAVGIQGKVQLQVAALGSTKFDLIFDFPKQFSEILVPQVLEDYTSPKQNEAPEDEDYGSILRKIVTAEGQK